MSITDALLSSANVGRVNRRIVAVVKSDYGLTISQQRPDAIRSRLKARYHVWNTSRSPIPAPNMPTTPAEVVDYLSDQVVVAAAKECVSEYRALAHYLRTHREVPVPMSHPTNESVTGTDLQDMTGALDV